MKAINMPMREDLLKRVSELTGAKMEEIEKIYLALVSVIINDMVGGENEGAIFREICGSASTPQSLAE